MATNFFKIKNGTNLNPSTSSGSVKGDLQYNSATDKLELYNGAVDPLVNEAKAATLTNKSMDGGSNTFTNIAYSSLVLTSSIVNADINASAAIVYSKLSLTNSIVNADIASGAAIVYSKLSLTNSIVNADIASGAAIAYSKLNLTGSVNLTSDVTGALPIANGGTGQITKAAAYDALSPNTTKGDIEVYTGSTNVRQGIGTDGQVLLADSSQTNGLKWATLQQGAKNYVTYNNFENNATTGWSLAHSALTSNFPSTVGSGGNAFSSAGGVHGGSAASGNLSIAATSTNPLAGTYSMNYVSSAATTAGDMVVSQSYTIDSEDQGKVLGFKFYYTPSVNPTNGNFSGTSSNSFGVAIYDLANNAWIMPAGVFNLVQNSGAGICQGTFQTPINMTGFQLALYNVNATSGALTLKVDDFYVGPQAIAFGPAVTDWTAFTPTGSWSTNTTYTGQWRRIGDSMEVQWHLALAGAPTSAVLSLNLPSVGSIDTTKLLANGSTRDAFLSYGTVNDTGAGYPIWAAFNSTTSVNVMTGNRTGTTYVFGSSVTQAVPVTFANGYIINLTALVPIVGWSSNTAMSADTDTRVVAMQANGVPTGTIGTTFGASTTAIYPTVAQDTHGAYSSGVYTVPVSGFYRVTAQAAINATYSAGNFSYASIYVNGTLNNYKEDSAGGVNVFLEPSVTATIKLNAGDLITTRFISNGTGPSFGGGTTNDYLCIERISGPAVVAATESVNLDVANCSTTLTNSTQVTLKFADTVFDSHNGYSASTGVYTIPVSGKYLCTMQVCLATFASGTVAAQNIPFFVVNGSNRANGDGNGAMTTTSAPRTITLTRILKLNAGDALRCDFNQSMGSTPTITNDTDQSTFFSVARVGN